MRKEATDLLTNFAIFSNSGIQRLSAGVPGVYSFAILTILPGRLGMENENLLTNKQNYRLAAR